VFFFYCRRTIDIFPQNVSFFLNKYNIPTCIFLGKYLFMPDSEMDFAVVIGKTMKLPQIADPSTADIDKYHELFLVAYQELFDRNKEQYAASGKDAVLEIL
jgi:hypothetical protein